MIPLKEALVPEHRHAELLQDRINRDPLMTGLTTDEVRFVGAYLNPGHGNNFMEAVPFPDGTPGNVFIFKSQWAATISASSQVEICNTPFFEVPFMVSVDGGALQAIDCPDMATPANIHGTSFLFDNDVYAFRCIGKAHTATNRTQVTGLAGSMVGCHKTPDVDHTTISYAEVALPTEAFNIRNLQEFPVTQADVTKIARGVDELSASEGDYAVSYHQTHEMTLRDTYPKKNWTGPSVANVIGKVINLYPMTGVVQPIIKYYNDALIPAIVSYPDNTDIACAKYEGLVAGTKFTVKFTVVYELLLKGNSPLLKQCVPRPPANFRLLEQLRAYETIRTSESNNGVLVASANFWSEIWDGFKDYALPVIGKVASTVFPEAKGLIKGVTSAISGTSSSEKLQKDGTVTKARPKMLIQRPATGLMKRPTIGLRMSKK